MRFRNGYLLAGVAWALFLAPVVAYTVLGVVLGVLWLWVFGDDPWPAATGWVIPVLCLAVLLTTAAGCILVAHRHGRRREIAARDDKAREWRRIGLWTLVPLVLIVITVTALWQRSAQQAEALAAMERRQAAFTDLLDARHRIAALAVRRDGAGDLEASVATSGGRPGPYRLLWQVNSMTYGEILSGEAPAVALGQDGAALRLDVSIDAIAGGYRDRFLTRGGVLIDEPFGIVVTLVPVIGARDVEAWPAFERHRWEQGDSPLRSSLTAAFPVRFRVDQDGTIEQSTP